MDEPIEHNRPHTESNNALPRKIPLAEAFRFWLKLGFVSFGGPAAQIALMHQELVERRRWVSEQRFMHALRYCMVLPGPEAQQLATYIGWLMHGTWGGIISGSLFILPSLAILIGLSWAYLTWSALPVVAGLLDVVKPAVTAIVVFAAYRIGSRSLTHPFLWLVAAGTFAAVFIGQFPFALIALAAGAIGLIVGRFRPEVFAAQKETVAPPADSAVHHHADSDGRVSAARVGVAVATGFGLWLLTMIALVLAAGTDARLVQMGWFFTKAAFLTFGGAYSVLPYVHQAAVGEYGWLTAEQMMDGLALGETTPGPLIMVVTFVGFVGAWTEGAFGAERLVAAGVAGALVATWFTFLPSFLFILVGAPIVEATRSDVKLTGPLTTVAAAVVGAIANLAVSFGASVLLPDGWPGRMNWFGLAVLAVSAIALFRYRISVVKLIAGCGVAGLIIALLFSTGGGRP